MEKLLDPLTKNYHKNHIISLLSNERTITYYSMRRKSTCNTIEVKLEQCCLISSDSNIFFNWTFFFVNFQCIHRIFINNYIYFLVLSSRSRQCPRDLSILHASQNICMYMNIWIIMKICIECVRNASPNG